MPVSNVEIVTFAVFALGGASKVVDTEDIAIESHAIAPSRFAWTKYPDQVNLELVRVFLSDAKKKSHGWLAGTGKDGWSLTPKGLKWVKENEHRMRSTEFSSRARRDRRSASPDERRWRREELRLRSLPAARAWIESRRPPTSAEAMVVFRIDSYVNAQMRDLKITRLLELFAQEPDLLEFVQAAADAIQPGERHEGL